MDSFIKEVEKDKILVIRTWVSSSIVVKIINDYSIDKDLFIKRYAFGFLEHYIKAVKNKQKIE